jgi:hypothetical protein
LVTLIGC